MDEEIPRSHRILELWGTSGEDNDGHGDDDHREQSRSPHSRTELPASHNHLGHLQQHKSVSYGPFLYKKMPWGSEQVTWPAQGARFINDEAKV